MRGHALDNLASCARLVPEGGVRCPDLGRQHRACAACSWTHLTPLHTSRAWCLCAAGTSPEHWWRGHGTETSC